MAKDIHIGKKIQDVLKQTRYKKTEFADMINISRTVVYDIFKRETIDTGLLKKISEVLNHDFFSYYEQASVVKENKADYGYATKSELADLAHAILKISKAVERIEEHLPVSKASATKKVAPIKKSRKK